MERKDPSAHTTNPIDPLPICIPIPSIYPGACTQDGQSQARLQLLRLPKYQTPETPFHVHELAPVPLYPRLPLPAPARVLFTDEWFDHRLLKRFNLSFSLQSSQYHLA